MAVAAMAQRRDALTSVSARVDRRQGHWEEALANLRGRWNLIRRAINHGLTFIRDVLRMGPQRYPEVERGLLDLIRIPRAP